MTNLVKRSLRCLVLIALFLGLVPVAMMAAEGDIVTTGTMNGVAIGENTITVSGAATMTGSGTGDAVTINADTTLVFNEGATLTLTGYTNGFVVNGATLSGGGWVINDGDGMDLIRLKTGGKLNITGDVDLNGHDKTDTTSRGIVLQSTEANGGQQITLAANTTLYANNFYRGLETGGAKNYTISGAGMDSSTFDFSGNNCGMALSYFDSNATFKNCKLEVSNCDASGIFMRQDNGFINGLYIDHVYINCVNDIKNIEEHSSEQTDIAIRLHSGNFEITNSDIYIENACNTGLWICDGLYDQGTRLIKDTTITVKNVAENPSQEFYGAGTRRKAITLVPWDEWTIDGCTIIMDGVQGTSSDAMQVGLNIASDIKINSSGFFNLTAKASYYGGKIQLKNTEITTAHLQNADIGVQIGQFLDIGENVVIDNDCVPGAPLEHYTILCDDPETKYSAWVLGTYVDIDYDVSNLPQNARAAKRVTISGGSFKSSDNQGISVFGHNVYENSIPVNAAGDELSMFKVDSEAYQTYMSNGVISLNTLAGETYSYSANKASADENYYIWAPKVVVTLPDGTDIPVPCGAKFGLTAELPDGIWETETGEVFDENTVVYGNVTLMQS